MDAEIPSKSTYSGETHERPAQALPSGSAGNKGLRLTRRASLVAALLVSLVLWAAIWAAVASLATAMLG